MISFVSPTATPVQARAGSCIPTLIPNTGASFINGQMLFGVFAYGVGQPIQTKNLTVPLVPTFVADPSGNGLVSIVPPPGAATLYPTSANGQITLQQRITTSPKNLKDHNSFNAHELKQHPGMGHLLPELRGPHVAYGCSIISLADTTQCVEAGTTAGQLALVKKCAGLRYGSQIFDLYVETLA
ncbi:hypothetical protein B0H13DRAFT_2165304 [Mycena leptocephala]|nr:hypothetical protein B0H13DRAFT_2165304 [Mycena leptocephala]